MTSQGIIKLIVFESANITGSYFENRRPAYMHLRGKTIHQIYYKRFQDCEIACFSSKVVRRFHLRIYNPPLAYGNELKTNTLYKLLYFILHLSSQALMKILYIKTKSQRSARPEEFVAEDVYNSWSSDLSSLLSEVEDSLFSLLILKIWRFCHGTNSLSCWNSSSFLP